MAATDETDRLVALSDGVFAIAITLLVLDIPLPEAGGGGSAELLGSFVREQGIDVFAYVLSFLVIGLYWVLHRNTFVHIRRHDRRLLWLNLLFLLAVSFLPYPTSVLTAFPNEFGVIFYAASQTVAGATLVAVWVYASRQELFAEGIRSHAVRVRVARFAVSPLVFVISIPIGLFDPRLGILCWLALLPLNGYLQSRFVWNDD
ncbi:Uncharacterized membrane protein [Natronoarchaeum philippinense]|uniref:Uncharacterized membrane protein n=1 Tax=Natronoarchaeum philippinense TaxID=558529 RepID=A0A285N9A9_NATPI|nr:TMEM175 family protein [Natronoarchaeum philippinense]SNZ06072.1 Uncharacterized membrane protein [Natronoarchaeum philippinense]